ncbi:MAG TPA: hypothetical protein VLH35_08130 [Candidatus Acidoferrales bacterium]|nr:hypothetical protein [Candidatus Acidoferrales bacterium]
MIRLQKLIVLLFSVLLFVPALLVVPVHAYSQPPTPEFTVNYIDESYDVTTTYEVDQFTGQTVVKQNGYHVDK